jgi:ribosomal protein S3
MGDFSKIIKAYNNKCPILGLRVIMSGRLGRKKKGMAQQIRRSVGKVPLSTLSARIDYCQEVIPSSYGTIGLKVWVCYSSYSFKR